MRRAAGILCALLALELALAVAWRSSDAELETRARSGSVSERIAALHALAGRGNGELPPAELLDAALEAGIPVAAYLTVQYRRHPQRAEVEARIRAHPAVPPDVDLTRLVEIRQRRALARALAGARDPRAGSR